MHTFPRLILAAAISGALFLDPAAAQKCDKTPGAKVACGASTQQASQGGTSSLKGPAARLLPIRVEGMTCKACVSKVTKALVAAGAKDVKVCLESGLASVVPGKDAKPQALVQAVSKAGFKAKSVPVTVYALSVEGMTCQACVSKVEKALKAFPAAYKVEVDLKKGRAIVRGPKGFLKPESLAKAVSAAKFAAKPLPTAMHCLDLKALGNDKDLKKRLQSIDGVLQAKVFPKFAHACVLTVDDKATTAAFEKAFGKAVRPACTAKGADSSKSDACDGCAAGKKDCLDCAGKPAKGSCPTGKAKGCGAKTKQ